MTVHLFIIAVFRGNKTKSECFCPCLYEPYNMCACVSVCVICELRSLMCEFLWGRTMMGFFSGGQSTAEVRAAQIMPVAKTTNDQTSRLLFCNMIQ